MHASLPRPIRDVARELGLDGADLLTIGDEAAKVRPQALARPRRGRGQIVLVSAITPTAHGEGKTTVAVGLAMALRRLGRRPVACLRQPSLGPVFGAKGGGTGGGRAQVVPAEEINLHFTGDMHAIGAAHNLLAALVDHDLHFGGSGLDPRRVQWPRVLDMDDRALRHVVIGLGGHADGVPRESRFDITAASEVMATLCLAQSLDDLHARLGRIVVGERQDGSEVTATDLAAADAMTVLLQRALWPNLVQTAEGGPAVVHGGPFANIAHGCSSLAGLRLALHYGDEVITEGGFGFDLGGEKFLHILCRQAGLWPDCVVLVVTARALREHGERAPGGADETDSATDGADALARGLPHLDRQVANVRRFGLEPVIALNVFPGDDAASLAAIERRCAGLGLGVAQCTAFTDGGEGALALGRLVAAALDAAAASPPAPRYLYALDDPYPEKLRAVATALYGARDVTFTHGAARELERIAAAGHAGLPVCVAKTHRSLSDDPTAGGLPPPFEAHVTEVRLAAGAGFVIALMGPIETMPGLPREPAARTIHLDAQGRARGLMQGDE